MHTSILLQLAFKIVVNTSIFRKEFKYQHKSSIFCASRVKTNIVANFVVGFKTQSDKD